VQSPEFQPNWCAGEIPAETAESYSAFSRQAFWGAYHHQASVALFHSRVATNGGDVLEVGCGPGWLTIVMQQLCLQARFCALDSSAEMLEAARANARQEGCGAIRFTEGIAERLPFPEASFDLVTSQAVLRQLDDPVAAIRETFRVLRPGGMAYFSDILGGLDEAERLALIEGAPGEHGGEFIRAAFASALDRGRIEAILAGSGVPRWECRVGALGGFTFPGRDVLEWVKQGFSLRELQARWPATAWSARMSTHWVHVYLYK
jgi:SAM-dependent methyltransferase